MLNYCQASVVGLILPTFEAKAINAIEALKLLVQTFSEINRSTLRDFNERKGT